MRSRVVRVTLTLLAVVAIGAAAWFYWTDQARVVVSAERVTAFHGRHLAAAVRVLELRSTQQAYVAAGQNEAFWFDRVTTEIGAVRAALTALEAETDDPAALAAIRNAVVSLDEFEELDRRVRSYASTGQKLLASDVIYSDSLDATAQIVSALDTAAAAMDAGHASTVQAATREQMMAVGGAAGIAILVLLLLAPRTDAPARRAVEAAALVEPKPSAPAVDDIAALDMRTPAPVAPPPAPPRASLEIETLAGVCLDLARLTDTSALPTILERTADALDASGLVLWVLDAGGRQLVPIASHGYPASIISRMGALPVDASNATADAFRTGLLQTVSAEGESKGAIAAPLVSPSGCLGVMSAEVRHEGEHHLDRLAAASIVAAQLATILGPPSTEDRSTAAL